MRPALSYNSVRFGPFQLDLNAGELHKHGHKVHLHEQPFQVLKMLLEHPGEVVTREEIRKRLWPNDTIVEFDNSINAAIKKLRLALGDSAEAPSYVETVPRRGYRLLVPVERVAAKPTEVQAETDHTGAQPQPPAEANLIGKRVSHYRVLEILGGGGMGVVYQAEDLKLGRRVAMKFLPEELAHDRIALERFEREARAASALEHPNICPIYEFGDHEGQPFIVMQLLDGQTLRERIVGPLAVDLLLDLAIQIAEGLDAAHQKGIIHRDIKPANIFITSRSEAKILDFGLARLEVGAEVATPLRETDPATNLSLTRTGIAMGTAGYMSPEQVRGEKLDTRTDLFSFGVVLYEMTTGQRAFTGETAAMLYDAIVNRAPTPPRELNPEIPPKLEGIINKALEKEREVRYQAASEMGAELKRVKRDTDRRRPARRRRAALVGVLALLLIAVAIFWLTKRLASPPGLPDLKQRQLTANSSESAVASGAISPDGRYLAYADLKGIHIKLIETGETENVPQPEDFKGMQVSWGIVTTWVRDGTRFIANAIIPGHRSSVWMVPVLGGPPRKLRDDAFAGSVSRDGLWVAFATKPDRVYYREMWLMRPDGGQARKLFEADEDSGFTGTEWSPNGQRLAYGRGHQVADQVEWSIETRDLKGGPPTTAINPAGLDWCWSPDGRMIYSQGEPGPFRESCNFWAVRIDARTGKPREQPKRLTNWAGFCMDDPSATADGKRLTFRKWSWQGNVYVADLETNGTHINIPRRLTLHIGQKSLRSLFHLR
jgi:serine/threonine protein kinase